MLLLDMEIPEHKRMCLRVPRFPHRYTLKEQTHSILHSSKHCITTPIYRHHWSPHFCFVLRRLSRAINYEDLTWDEGCRAMTE